MPMSSGQLVTFIIGLLVVIFGAYYITYFIGRRAQGQSTGRLRNKNINLIDRFAISKDKSFCIVEIAGKVYVMGITNQTMTLIDTLDAEAFSKAAAVGNMGDNEGNLVPVSQNQNVSPLVKKLSNFIAEKTGRPQPFPNTPLKTADISEAETFSQTMDKAIKEEPNDKTVTGTNINHKKSEDDNPEE